MEIRYYFHIFFPIPFYQIKAYNLEDLDPTNAFLLPLIL